MRRTLRRSGHAATALLIIALLGAVLLGSVRDASCAMHGLGILKGDAGSPAAMTAHGGHRAPHVSHEGGQHSHDAEHPGCDCTCIGDCTMVAPLATSPSVATLRVALIDPAPRRTLDIEPALAPPAEPDGLLPFANGPPASTLV